MDSRWNVIKAYKSRVNMDVFTKFMNIRTRWRSLSLQTAYFHSNKQYHLGYVEFMSSVLCGLGLR